MFFQFSLTLEPFSIYVIFSTLSTHKFVSKSSSTNDQTKPQPPTSPDTINKDTPSSSTAHTASTTTDDKRVVPTGAALLAAFGEDWQAGARRPPPLFLHLYKIYRANIPANQRYPNLFTSNHPSNIRLAYVLWLFLLFLLFVCFFLKLRCSILISCHSYIVLPLFILVVFDLIMILCWICIQCLAVMLSIYILFHFFNVFKIKIKFFFLLFFQDQCCNQKI